MFTKKDLKESLAAQRKDINKDIETANAQVIDAVIKHTASKQELQEFKDEFKEFKEEVKSEFKDVKRQINDLKADVPTPQEFADHEKRITKLEIAVIPQ